MGEGYRIIAASKGLRPDEKQTITRMSPSHDSLCAPPADALESIPLRRNTMSALCGGHATQAHRETLLDAGREPVGFSFYPLPGGRLCAAHSRPAGAEHTGRGGQRVYTQNVVLSPEQFQAFHFNPFAVLRAILRSVAAEPQLSPPPILQDLQLSLGDPLAPESNGSLDRHIPASMRRYLLAGLLGDRRFVVNGLGAGLDLVEALMLGLPGPMRARASLSVGMKFSAGRTHRLQWLNDDGNKTKARIVGVPVEYLDVTKGKVPEVSISGWVRFVDRMWAQGDLQTLAARTSQPFRRWDVDARERVARWYEAIDSLAQIDTKAIMSLAGGCLQPREDEVERAIVRELLSAVQSELLERFRRLEWKDWAHDSSALLDIWKRGNGGPQFVEPIIAAIFNRLMEHARQALPAELDQISRIVHQWRRLPPGEAALQKFSYFLQPAPVRSV
jgi:hypothetical protein